MDADCLIKLTEAHLNEQVCRAFAASIPTRVRVEIVD